ncbi:hypothetical protein HK097_002797, partial [Rhizophlyctis rosea]
MFKKEKVPLPKIQKKKHDGPATIKTDIKGANLVKKEDGVGGSSGSPTAPDGGGGVKPMELDSVPAPSSGPVSYRKRDRSSESPTEVTKKEGVPVPGWENYLSTGILMKKREKGLKVVWREDNLEEVRVFETPQSDSDDYGASSSSYTPHQHGNARDLDRSEGKMAMKHMRESGRHN